MNEETQELLSQALSESARLDAEHGVAHHGPPILTAREASICQAMALWIDTVRNSGAFYRGKDWLPGHADICKSRLFWRIRSGKRPLPHRPPTAYSCPWYELIDEADRPHWAYEVTEHEGCAFVAQCQYEIVERIGGVASRLAFGPWIFRVWSGKSPYQENHEGWWIQVEP